jgi:hypothetical protein
MPRVSTIIETYCIISTRVWDHLIREAWPDPLGMSPGVGTIITLQSLHHSSIGYQHAHTQVGLSKKDYAYKCNREHKQEQKRI